MAPKKTGMVAGGKPYVAQVPNARGEYSTRDEHYVSPDPRPSSQELRAASQRSLVAKLTGGPAKVTSTNVSEPEKKRPPSATTNPDHSSQEADGSSQHQYDANLISDNITKRDIARDHYPPVLRQFLAFSPDEAVRRLVNDVNMTDAFVAGSDKDRKMYLQRLSTQSTNLANFFNEHQAELANDKINANVSAADITLALVSHMYNLHDKATKSDYKPDSHVWDNSVGSFYSNEKDLGKNIVPVPKGSEQLVLDKFTVPNTTIRNNFWKPATSDAPQPPDRYDSEILKAFQTGDKTGKLELYEDIVEDAFLVFLPLTVNFLVNQLKKANKAKTGILDDRLGFDEDMTNLQLYLNELTDKRNAFIDPDGAYANVEKHRNIDNAFSTYPLINQLIGRLVDWDIGDHVFKHPSVAWEDAAKELIESGNTISRNQQDARELAETIVRAADLAARLEHHVKGVDTEENPLLKTRNYLETDPETRLFVTDIVKESDGTLTDLVKVLTHFQDGTLVPDVMKTKGTMSYSDLDKVYNNFFDGAYSEELTSQPELGPNDPKAGEYLGREIIDREREVDEASDFKPSSVSQIFESQSAPQETSESLINETSERLINSLAARGYNISKLPPRDPASPVLNQPDEESTIPLVTESSVPLSEGNLASLNALHQTFTNLASKVLGEAFYESDPRKINELAERILNQYNDQNNVIRKLYQEQEHWENIGAQGEAKAEWARSEINKSRETIQTMVKETEGLREEQRRLQNQVQERTKEVGLIQEELKNQATAFGQRLSEIEEERTKAIDDLNQRKVAHDVQITKLTAEAQRLQQALQRALQRDSADSALANQNAALRDEASFLRDQLREKQDQILQLETEREEIAQQYLLLEREHAALETAARVITEERGTDAGPIRAEKDQEIQAAVNAPDPQIVETVQVLTEERGTDARPVRTEQDQEIQAAVNASVPQPAGQDLLNHLVVPVVSILQGRVASDTDLLISHLAGVRDRIDAANERLNQAHMTAGYNLDQARETNNSLTTELEQTKANLEHVNDFVEQLKHNNRTINQANLELGKQLELKEAVNQDLQRQLDNAIGELNRLGSEKTEREAYVLNVLTERELAYNQLRVKEAEILEINGQLKNLADQLTNVQGKLSISEADLKHYKAKTRDLEAGLDEKDAELEEYQREGFQRARLLDDKNAVIRDLTERIQEATRETAEAQEQTANALRDVYMEELRARNRESVRIDAYRLKKEIDFDFAARKQELANQERELIHRLKANERAEERVFRAQEMMFQGEREDARRGADHQRRIDRLNLETAGRREDREHRAALDLSRQATRGNMSLNARATKNKASAGLISKLAGSTDPVIKALGATMFTSYLKDLVSLSDDELMGTDYEQLIKMHDDGSIDRIIAALATPSSAINDTLGKRISDLENTTRNFINMVSQRTAHVGAAQAYHPPRRVFVGRDGRAYQGNRRAGRVARPRRLPPRNSRGRFVRRVKK